MRVADVESVERKSWVLTALLLLLSLPFRSVPVSGGVALGSLLAVVNFKWLRDFVAALISGGRGVSRFLIFLYTLKYVFTGIVIFLSLRYDLANAFALLSGVSVVFLAICWEGIAAQRKPLREETNHAG